MGQATDVVAQIRPMTAPSEASRMELERSRPALNAGTDGSVREVTQPTKATQMPTRTWD